MYFRIDNIQDAEHGYNVLMRAANDPSKREFENGISSTEDIRDFLFKIKGRRAELPVKFYDFPGGWMSPSSPRSNTIIDIIINSAVIIVAINTPFLMEFDGKYSKHWCSAEGIEWIIEDALSRDSNKDRLILFVPIKCERYMGTPEERDKMQKNIRRAFAKTLELLFEPLYRDKLADCRKRKIQTVQNQRR